MDFSEIFVSAFEAIRINKVRSALTSLGIIIGVASVILLISLGTGLQKSITSQFERLGTNTLYVMPGNIGEGAGFAGGGGLQTNKLKFSDADLIERNVDNIASVSNGVESITSVEYRGEKRNGVIFLGVDAEFWATGAYKLDSGRFFSKAEDSSAKRVVVVGKTIVEKLFAGQDPIGKQLTVRGKRYQVIGVLEELGSVVGQDQDNIVIIPAETANLQIGFDRPTWILISAASSDAIPEIQSDVTELLGKRLADDEFSVQDIVAASRRVLKRGFTPSHATQILQALGEKGLVYRNRRAGYCFAVPLLSKFITRQEWDASSLPDLT